MLRAFTGDQPMNWENKLPYVVSSYNACVNSVTGFSPYELVFGKTMSLPSSVTGQKYSTYNYDDFAHEVRENLYYGWKQAREKLINRKQKNKTYFDKKNKTKSLQLKIGDMVLLKNMHRKTKYDPNYVGPFEIIGLTGENTIKLKDKNQVIRAHKDHVKLFHESNASSSSSDTDDNLYDHNE